MELRLHFYSNVNNERSCYPSVSTWSPSLDEAKLHPLTMFEKHVDSLEENFILQHFNRLKCMGNDSLLIKAVRALKAKEHITIAKADKNMGVCVLSTTDFIKFGVDLISDKSVYFTLSLKVFEEKIKDAWIKLELILQTYGLLYEENGWRTGLAKSLLHLQKEDIEPANLQLLFKVHKTPLKVRPIANNFATITTNTSIYIHNCLQKYLEFMPTIAISSRKVLEKLKNFQCSAPNLQLATIDIANFYPSITHAEGLSRTRNFLTKLIHRHKLRGLEDQLEHLLEMLEWVLRNNFVTFNGVIAHQIKGTAMGTNVAVVYANIVAASIEDEVIKRLAHSINFYTRYIDDIFVIGTDIPTLINQLNEQSPTIKFERTSDRTDCVNFLDAEIEIIDNKISSKLYEKPGNQHSYILPTSNHIPAVQINLIKTEVQRLRALCSSDENFFDSINMFKRNLQLRKYNSGLLSIVDLLAFKANQPPEPPKKPSTQNKLCIILNDHNKKLTFPLKRLLTVPRHIADVSVAGVPQVNATKYGRFLSKILEESVIGNKMGLSIFNMLQRKKRVTKNSQFTEPSRKRAREEEQDRGGETANSFAIVCAPASPNPNPNPHANPRLTLAKP